MVAAIYAHTEALAGWRPAELRALLGVFFVLTGLLGSVVQPSLYALMEEVRLGSLAFWFIRVDNALIIFLTFWEAGRWPVQVYPEWLGRTLTFLVPVALATTIPAEALRGRLGPGTLIAAVGLAAVLLVASRLLWLR